jgi:hypothetical protein
MHLQYFSAISEDALTKKLSLLKSLLEWSFQIGRGKINRDRMRNSRWIFREIPFFSSFKETVLLLTPVAKNTPTFRCVRRGTRDQPLATTLSIRLVPLRRAHVIRKYVFLYYIFYISSVLIAFRTGSLQNMCHIQNDNTRMTIPDSTYKSTIIHSVHNNI